MNSLEIYGILGLIIVVVGWLLLRTTKQEGAVTDQNKNEVVSNQVAQKELSDAAKPVSADEAYNGLLDKDDTNGKK